MASISAIIPVLDEEAALPALLESLKAQREVQIEIIGVDGGSADGSEAAFKTHAPEGSLWLNAPKGRASQMNAGAKAASGEYLLFIHADSLLEGENLLRDALCLLLDEKNSGQKIAGKWAVDFCLPENSFAAFFMQAKTALERADAYAGDQGLLLARSYFLELGGFDETPPFLEDLALAAKIVVGGRFVRLPGKMKTSPRRFWAEGLFERQLLNALLRFALFSGRWDFLQKARGIYKEQALTGPIAPAAFMKTLAKCGDGGKISLLRDLYLFGFNNGWQFIFWRKCKESYRLNKPATTPSDDLPSAGLALCAISGVFVAAVYWFFLFFPAWSKKIALSSAPSRMSACKSP